LAGAIELLASNLVHKTSLRITRLVLVIATAIGMPFALWPKIIERQTNADIVARKLEESAQLRDVIIANPWFLGISFNWYYHGNTPWITCPTMVDHRMHRFDLLKAKMISPTPIDDLLETVRQTLQSNN